jgi:hypothetical protein
MGKVKSSDSSRLRQYVNDFKDVFTPDCKVLFCQARGKSIVATFKWKQAYCRHCPIKKKGWPSRQSLIGKSSATCLLLEDFTIFPLLRQICAKYLCPQTYHFLK